MNDPDDLLRAHFQRQRRRDQNSAPNFSTLPARARPRREAPRLPWRWLAPASAAVVMLAALCLRPRPAPSHEYSDRIAALVADFEAPAFASAELPSDALPAVFSEL